MGEGETNNIQRYKPIPTSSMNSNKKHEENYTKAHHNQIA